MKNAWIHDTIYTLIKINKNETYCCVYLCIFIYIFLFIFILFSFCSLIRTKIKYLSTHNNKYKQIIKNNKIKYKKI